MKKTEFQKMRSLDAKLDNWLREQEKKEKKNKKYEKIKKHENEEEEEEF